MIERDYIMRMISMLVMVMERVLHLRKEHDYPAALLEVEEACRLILGTDTVLIDAFSGPQILGFFGRDPEVAPVKWYILGMLLRERGDLLRHLDREREAHDADQKALALLLASFHDEEKPVEPDHTAAIDALARSGATHGAADLAADLAGYYEKQGLFSKAEDALLDLLDESADHEPLVHAFYDRLLQHTDEELNNGNLPREEVLEGRERLKRRE